MKYFEHTRVGSFQEAGELLKTESRAAVIAGGTDLLSTIKNELFEDTPQLLVDIKGIRDAGTIRVSEGKIKIGALTKLTDIAENETILELTLIHI